MSVCMWLPLICVMLLYSSMTYARDWQLMLVQNAQEQTLSQSQQLQFEAGLTDAISQGLNNLVSIEAVYPLCKERWCGEPSAEALLTNIKAKAPQVQLVILYEIIAKANNQAIIQAQLIDPLSYQIRFNHTTPITTLIGSNITDQTLFKIGRRFGENIDVKLSNVQAQNTYLVYVDGFEGLEVVGLSTYLLSNAYNENLILLRSEQFYLLGQYFAITNSQYQLSSSLNASQLQQMLAVFFDNKGINVSISFDLSSQKMIVARQGNPYAPSLITWFIVLIVFAVFASILIRRQYLQYYLHEHANNHNADAWLKTYKKAKFPLYRLHAKWRSRSIYWERLQRESDEYFDQAKVYFDAGDMNTAKLFISKSLHSNVANEQALALVDEIEFIESNEKTLSETEQWIRNKIAKAMNNYRQKQALKAMRQLYQAYDKAKQVKGLKKQSKAINKLIKNMSSEFANECHSIVVNCSTDASSILICQNDTVHLGRLPNKTDIPWISAQDSVFYINHKQVSRIGQHCSISRTENGYSLTDVGSKNGSYINGDECIKHKAMPLQNQDRIQLGSCHNVTSLTLAANLSPAATLLTLAYVPPSINLFDRNELNRVWPDNALAMRTKLACMKDVCVLTYDTTKKTMNLEEIILRENDKFSTLSKSALANTVACNTSEVLVCMIRLGKQASITPINDDLDVLVDNVPLIGQIPVIFPCNIVFDDVHFQITEYDSKTLRYAQKHLTQIHNEVGRI